MCAAWAKAGECTKNPKYMLGTVVAPGACRKSCNACSQCAKGDVLCERRTYGQAVQQAGASAGEKRNG